MANQHWQHTDQKLKPSHTTRSAGMRANSHRGTSWAHGFQWEDWAAAGDLAFAEDWASAEAAQYCTVPSSQRRKLAEAIVGPFWKLMNIGNSTRNSTSTPFSLVATTMASASLTRSSVYLPLSERRVSRKEGFGGV